MLWDPAFFCVFLASPQSQAPIPDSIISTEHVPRQKKHMFFLRGGAEKRAPSYPVILKILGFFYAMPNAPPQKQGLIKGNQWLTSP